MLRVLIIVENLPVERDSRVRRECQALVNAGYGVSVICPRGQDGGVFPELRDVEVHRYRPPPEARTKAGFAFEFLYSWLAAAALTVRVAVGPGFDAIQACNPPDTYFALALPWKLMGKRFVFDHHDLAPELFVSRFGDGNAVVVAMLRGLERATFLTADHVIANNESTRHVALTRGRRNDDSVTVVRNGPVLARTRGRESRPELKQGRRFLCCWVGIIRGVDDGVDVALRAIHHLVFVLGERDCHFAFLGDGEASERMRTLAAELEILDHVTFTGWVGEDVVFDYLATADVGLQPNPKTPRMELATAIKTVEYMAFGLPVVAFDVEETRRSAGDAAAYADNGVESFARLVRDVVHDRGRRAEMGRIGRQRVADELAWEHQEVRYVGVYRRVLARREPHR